MEGHGVNVRGYNFSFAMGMDVSNMLGKYCVIGVCKKRWNERWYTSRWKARGDDSTGFPFIPEGLMGLQLKRIEHEIVPVCSPF